MARYKAARDESPRKSSTLAMRCRGLRDLVASKRKKSTTSNVPTLPAANIFRFLDLPAEIRIQVYVLLLDNGRDSDEPSHRCRDGWREFASPLKVDIQIRGVYSPYTYWYHVGEERRFARRRRRFAYSHTLLHADPVIMQVNRQIRQESQSLYLREYLSVELFGRGPSWMPERHFSSFECWSKSKPMKKLDLSTIRRLEVRQHVNVIDPDSVSLLQLRENLGLALPTVLTHPYVWIKTDMATVVLSVENAGQILEARSKLDVFTGDKQTFDEQARRIVKKRGDEERFTGRDLVSILRWLGTSPEPRRFPPLRAIFKAPSLLTDLPWPAVGMMGTLEEVQYDPVVPENSRVPTRILGIKPGFRHLVTRVEIGEVPYPAMKM
jgi:hypothetical protein